MKKAAITILCILQLWNVGFGGEVWIAFRPLGEMGTGTEADPYNGNGPNPDDTQIGTFDRLFLGIPEGTTIHIGPGTYLSGTRFIEGINIKNGWKIIGAGMDKTVINKVNVHERARYAVFMGHDDNIENIYISDLSIHLPTVQGAYRFDAVSFRAKTGIIERIKVTNPRSVQSGEGFTLCIVNNSLSNAWGRIANCEVVFTENIVGNYVTAIFLGGQGFTGYLSGVIENNLVHDLSPAPASVNAYGSGQCNDLMLHNNTSVSMGAGIVMDTYSHLNVSIVGNRFLDCKDLGMGIGGGPYNSETKVTQKWDGFVIRGNVLTIRNRGLVFNGTSTNFTLANNTVFPADGYQKTAINALEIMDEGSGASNSGFALLNNQFASNLKIHAPSSTITRAVNNQTGSTPQTSIPGNTRDDNPGVDARPAR